MHFGKRISWILLAAGMTLAPTFTGQSLRIGGVPTIPNGIVSPPAILIYTRPPYTDEALRRGIEGNVSVDAQFEIDGSFRILRVVKGLGFGLDENALAALQSWSFTPAISNGARVAVISRIDIEFRLPTRFNYSDGSFRLEDGTWREYNGTQPRFSFVEVSRDGARFTIFDSSRSMYLRLPMTGGVCDWSTDRVTWRELYTVVPESR